MNLESRLTGTASALLLTLSCATSFAQAVLPARVEQAAQERIAAGTYPTLVIAVTDGKAVTVRSFGKLDDGKAPDGDTVYEIGSITKTFTATLLAEAVQSGRVTLETPVGKLLPDFKIPERGGKLITLGLMTMSSAALGWLVGPSIGTAVFNSLKSKYKGPMAIKESEFFARVKKHRVDPSASSVRNPGESKPSSVP